MRMLGPSMVSGCPQQNAVPRPMPSGGNNSGNASAAQPFRGHPRDCSPATAPPANRPSTNTTSDVMIGFLLPLHDLAHLSRRIAGSARVSAFGLGHLHREVAVSAIWGISVPVTI